MQIYPSTLRTALFALLRQEMRESAAVQITEIKRAWPDTGFRRSDFSKAVAALLQERQGRIYRRFGVTWLQLNEAGMEELHYATAPSSHRFIDWLVVRRMRRRQLSAEPGAASPVDRRRAPVSPGGRKPRRR